MSDRKESCALCYYFDSFKCRRHAPQPAWQEWQFAVLASLFRQYWKGDPEVDKESLDQIASKYCDVSNHRLEFVAWPFIRFPEEEWCGDWKSRDSVIDHESAGDDEKSSSTR
jgi:hypothetical protein